MNETHSNDAKIPHVIVQKYGGATLSTPKKILDVAQRISKLHKSGNKMVVVVSAMGQTTNDLIKLAQQISHHPPLRELDMLLSVGERISMSLLSMALNEIGCSAISFTGSQAGILTDDSHVNASIIDVKPFRVEEALNNNKIVILAGFQGVSSKTKEVTTLGRGGSDISAVAMAAYLNAEKCEILKDVEAVYTADPKIVSDAQPIHKLSFDELFEMTQWGAKVLHFKSVELASNKNVKLFIGPASDDNSTGTLIEHRHEPTIQKQIAINSFSKIFKLKIKNPNYVFEDFQKFLQNNQIGNVQLLKRNQELIYFTAADEILISIQNLNILPTDYELLSTNLSSVSVTFAKTCQNEDLHLLTEQLKNSDIIPESAFHLGSGAHFFVNSDKRIDSIKILHRLCKT